MKRPEFPVILVLILILTGCHRTKTEYWPNGVLKSEIMLRKDQYDGSAKFYYETGQLQISGNYKQNKLDGPYILYHPNGKKKEEQYFKNGIQVGVHKIWDTQGTLITNARYSNGKLDGRFTEYWSNGTVKTEGEFSNGLYDGFWLYYDYSGTVVGEARFNRGTGYQKAVNPDGSVRQITRFSDNVKDGEERFFTPEGKIERVNRYVNGRLTQP